MWLTELLAPGFQGFDFQFLFFLRIIVHVCVYADMYDGLCLLQKKIKDLGRCKDILFLDSDSFHRHV